MQTHRLEKQWHIILVIIREEGKDLGYLYHWTSLSKEYKSVTGEAIDSLAQYNQIVELSKNRGEWKALVDSIIDNCKLEYMTKMNKKRNKHQTHEPTHRYALRNNKRTTYVVWFVLCFLLICIIIIILIFGIIIVIINMLRCEI